MYVNNIISFFTVFLTDFFLIDSSSVPGGKLTFLKKSQKTYFAIFSSGSLVFKNTKIKKAVRYGLESQSLRQIIIFLFTKISICVNLETPNEKYQTKSIPIKLKNGS